GDAPAPYPAASVSSQTGPRLGESYVDNGIQFATVRVGALDAMVEVDIQSATARLDGWIDFNDDKTFSGEGEQIFDAAFLTIGKHWLMFDVPSWAEEGTTQARFRVSSSPNPASGLGQGGIATGGEVEDHLVEIVAPIPGTGNFGPADNVNTGTNSDGVVDVLTGDFNSDGRMDIVSSSYVDGQISLWKQTATSWTRTLVGTVATSIDFSAVGLVADDFDGDGDLDVASASTSDNTIAWYRNNNNGSSFTKITIGMGADGARAIVAADFDQDGHVDLASASLVDGLIRVHRNTGTGNLFSIAATEVVNANMGGQLDPGLSDIFTADINSDGRIDIVSSAATFNRVAWYENDGSPFTGSWSGHNILPDSAATGEPRASGVFAADFDNDGDLDVVATNFDDDKLVWFRNQIGQGGAQWSGENLIAAGLDGANPPFVADVDGNGSMDVVVPSYFDDEINWYRNNGSSAFALGDTLTIDTPTNVTVADIDDDGVLDIVGASDVGDSVDWFKNPAAAFIDLPGDYNDDLKVDFVDYIEWRKAFGTSDVATDGNNDGTVNAADYTVWRDNLGATASAASSAQSLGYAAVVLAVEKPLSVRMPHYQASQYSDVAFTAAGNDLAPQAAVPEPATAADHSIGFDPEALQAALSDWQNDPLTFRWRMFR
ncbi:MAG: FG-GAP repeat domain-containing protein, partial [Aeoliella sp.]